MRRTAVLALSIALLVPAAAVAAGSSSRTGAVRAHYRHIYLGNFAAAWALLTPAAKRQLGPYSSWKKGYAETGQVTVYSLKRVGSAMRFNLASCRSDGDREVTIHERFRVTWPVRKVGGRWFLAGGVKVTRTSRGEVERCSLPLP